MMKNNAMLFGKTPGLNFSNSRNPAMSTTNGSLAVTPMVNKPRYSNISMSGKSNVKLGLQIKDEVNIVDLPNFKLSQRAFETNSTQLEAKSLAYARKNMNPVARFLKDADNTKKMLFGSASHGEKIEFVK